MATTQAATTAATRTPRVLVYGDSLIWVSQDYLSFQFGLDRVDNQIRSYGGTAICDWFSDMTKTVASYRPDLVVLEFSGNYFTSCIKNTVGGATTDQALTPAEAAALVAKYAADARTATTIASRYGAKVLWAAPPAMPTRPWWKPIADTYRALPSSMPAAAFIDAGNAVSPNGKFVWRLPCSVADHCQPPTTVQVRSADQIHFCPAPSTSNAGVVSACPVWSSGAWRFAAAITGAAVSNLHSRHLL
jgi:hypothetical protein